VINLEDLRREFPTWHIEPRWMAANSGPDIRTVRAVRDDAQINARDEECLAALLAAYPDGAA
jgi:hypothetical protein